MASEEPQPMTPSARDERTALDALHAGLRDRHLEVKGDGDWEQMVKTVLLLIDQQKPLFGRIEELSQRLKCADAALAAARQVDERLRQFVEWVAGHQLVQGVYANDDHPYDEWITPDKSEMDFNDVHERARAALLATLTIHAVLASADSESREETP